MRHYTTTFGLTAFFALVAAAGCGQGPGDPAGGSQALLQSQSETNGSNACSPASPPKGRPGQKFTADHDLQASLDYYDFSSSRTTCPGTTPLGPATCPEGSKTILRGLVVETRMNITSGLEDTPWAVNGTTYAVLNQNGDAKNEGPVWGKWHEDLDGGHGTWDGSWTGNRVLGGPDCEGASRTPCWTQTTQIVGCGTSGDVKGLQMRATAHYAIYTPGFHGEIEGLVF